MTASNPSIKRTRKDGLTDSIKEKNVWMAAILAFFLGFMGIGHYYADNQREAVIIAFSFVTWLFLIQFSFMYHNYGMFLVLMIIGIICWLYQTVHAYQRADQYNLRLN